jgi:hypothetical protein
MKYLGSLHSPGNRHEYGAEGGEVLSVPHGRVQPPGPGDVHIIPQTLDTVRMFIVLQGLASVRMLTESHGPGYSAHDNSVPQALDTVRMSKVVPRSWIQCIWPQSLITVRMLTLFPRA